MQKQRNRRLVGLLAVVAFLALTWWASRIDPTTTSHVEPIAAVPPSPKELAMPASSGLPALSAAEFKSTPLPVVGARPGAESLYKEFRDAADLRVFVEKAKARPERGGILYTSVALLDCSAMRASNLGPDGLAQRRSKLAAAPSESSTKQLAAIEWMERRCGSFTPAELGTTEYRNVIASNQGRDQLQVLQSKAMSAGSTVGDDRKLRAALMSELMRSGDPLLMGEAVVMGRSSGSENGAETVYLDGLAHGGVSAEQFYLARRLMSCRLGNSCDTSDLEVHHECIVNAQCAGSIESLVRAQLGSTEDFQRVSKVADRLVAVARAADPAPLLPPQ